MPNAVLGSVLSLWRYPVKSMQGEELEVADVTARGIAGDRAYALIDKGTGKVASAKNPRKWGRLFECAASFAQQLRRGEPTPPVNITLPGGTVVNSEQDDVDRVLSEFLNRDVTLAVSVDGPLSLEEYWPDIDGLAHRETVTDEEIAGGSPPGTFFDYAVTHVLTTATLDRLHELYPEGQFAVQRFRPNIVVRLASGERGFAENEWVGRVLETSGGVHLNVSIPCPRCVMTTLPQGRLPHDTGILRTAAMHNRVYVEPLGQALPSVGVYAGVRQGGFIQRGDSIG